MHRVPGRVLQQHDRRQGVPDLPLRELLPRPRHPDPRAVSGGLLLQEGVHFPRPMPCPVPFLNEQRFLHAQSKFLPHHNWELHGSRHHCAHRMADTR